MSNESTPLNSGPGTLAVLLSGMMTTLEEGSNRRQKICGTWTYEGNGPAASTNIFRLERVVPASERLVSSARAFSGSFHFEGQPVSENGVAISFHLQQDGRSFVVKGRGENQFGLFTLEGSAAKSSDDTSTYVVQLRKYYKLHLRVGSKVMKYFTVNDAEARPFAGEITEYNASQNKYTVKYYADGDVERGLDEEEVNEMVRRHMMSQEVEAMVETSRTIAGMTTRIDNLEATAATANEAFGNIHTQLENLGGDITDIAGALETQDTRIDDLDEDLNRVSEEQRDQKKAITKQKTLFQRLQNATKRNQAQNRKIKNIVLSHSKTIKGIEKELITQKKTLNTYMEANDSKVNALESTVKELAASNKELKADNDKLKANQALLGVAQNTQRGLETSENGSHFNFGTALVLEESDLGPNECSEENNKSQPNSKPSSSPNKKATSSHTRKCSFEGCNKFARKKDGACVKHGGSTPPSVKCLGPVCRGSRKRPRMGSSPTPSRAILRSRKAPKQG